MIILSTFLVVALIALAAVIVRIVLNPKWTWLNRIIIVFIALSIVLVTIIGVANGVCRSTVKDLAADYETLVLYQSIVANCNNEYVRFDFYERVNNYNRMYADAAKQSENPWLDAFFPKDWTATILPINFQLHGDEYVGFE